MSAPYQLTDLVGGPFTDAQAREWMRRIDNNFHAGERLLGWFAPHQLITIGSPTPYYEYEKWSLNLELDPGHIFDPALAGGTSRLTEVPLQTVGGFTTPAAGAVRIDRVVVDGVTGIAERVAGTPAIGSPSAQPPAIPAGKLPICQVRFTDQDLWVHDSMITDERCFKMLNFVYGADFDGDSIARGAGLTGAADSKSGIFSGWMRIDGSDSFAQALLAIPGNAFVATRNSSNKLAVSAENAAGATILTLSSTTTYTAGATWRHLLASWDLAAGVGHLYVNDVNDLDTATDLLTDDTIDYTGTDWLVLPANANSCLAEIYFAQGQYLDFSVEANRRKFILSSGKPAFLGHDGSRPTGTAPIVYFGLRNDEAPANFALNRGTGGNFTITGALAAASSSPSD